MQYRPVLSAFSFILLYAFSVSAFAETAEDAEALVYVVLIGVISFGNILWPAILPAFFLSSAKKKISFYILSVCVCGVLSWLLTYVLPRQLDSGLSLGSSMQNVRIVVLSIILGSAVAIFASVRVIPIVRDLNDSHN